MKSDSKRLNDLETVFRILIVSQSRVSCNYITEVVCRYSMDEWVGDVTSFNSLSHHHLHIKAVSIATNFSFAEKSFFVRARQI